MNKQRKVLVTVTYNELGIIIDTKTEEVKLATDCISRADAVALAEDIETKRLKGEINLTYAPMIKGIMALPPAQPKIIRCKDCKYQDKGENESGSWNCCSIGYCNVEDDYFCWWAERRQDGTACNNY